MPPLTPGLPPRTALSLVLYMGAMAPARPQDLASAHSLPQPQPCSRIGRRPSKSLIVPGEVSERQQLDEYMKGGFVQVSRSGGWGLRGRRAAWK